MKDLQKELYNVLQDKHCSPEWLRLFHPEMESHWEAEGGRNDLPWLRFKETKNYKLLVTEQSQGCDFPHGEYAQ